MPPATAFSGLRSHGADTRHIKGPLWPHSMNAQQQAGGIFGCEDPQTRSAKELLFLPGLDIEAL
jgi:hypothetical protein